MPLRPWAVTASQSAWREETGVTWLDVLTSSATTLSLPKSSWMSSPYSFREAP